MLFSLSHLQLPPPGLQWSDLYLIIKWAVVSFLLPSWCFAWCGLWYVINPAQMHWKHQFPRITNCYRRLTDGNAAMAMGEAICCHPCGGCRSGSRMWGVEWKHLFPSLNVVPPRSAQDRNSWREERFCIPGKSSQRVPLLPLSPTTNIKPLCVRKLYYYYYYLFFYYKRNTWSLLK